MHHRMGCSIYPATADTRKIKAITTSFDVGTAFANKDSAEKEGLVWGVIRTAMASVSNLAMAQFQDYLELGEEGRMNCPGILSDCNWTWRAKNGIMGKNLAKKILAMTKLYGRCGGKQ